MLSAVACAVVVGMCFGKQYPSECIKHVLLLQSNRINIWCDSVSSTMVLGRIYMYCEGDNLQKKPLRTNHEFFLGTEKSCYLISL